MSDTDNDATAEKIEKTSLATRVIISSLAAATILAALLITFYSFRSNGMVSESLASRGSQVAMLQATALIQPVSDYEMEPVEKMLTALVADGDMQAARVFDGDEQVMAEAGEWLENGKAVMVFRHDLTAGEGENAELLGRFELQVSRAALLAAQKQDIWIGIGAILTIAAALFLVIKLSLLQITRPLHAMIGVMGALSSGDTSIEVPEQSKTNEIGEIARAVQVFKDSLMDTERLRTEREGNAARAAAEQQDMRRKMADEFEANVGAIVSEVANSANTTQSSAQSMSQIAADTARQAVTLSNASSEASENIQTVSAASEQLASSIQEIGRQVTASTEIANGAVHEAQATNEQIQGLADASDRIGEVVALINDIANQTNLLALNATIEAARAGDAGKGFAVVASEVKNLANQTAKATEDISGQIGGIQDATKDAVDAIGGIGRTIDKINEITASVSAAVEQQGAATQEIARSIEQAARGTADMGSSIGNVTNGADKTGDASAKIVQAADDMSQQTEKLRGEVGKFLQNVRAG